MPEMEITITIFSRQLRDLNVDGVELETAWANVAIKIQYFFPFFCTPRIYLRKNVAFCLNIRRNVQLSFPLTQFCLQKGLGLCVVFVDWVICGC